MLSIEAARKSFGAFEALRGIDLTCERGQLVTLLGPSGCGKTTLLRAIAGFETLDAGQIRIRGDLVSGPRLHLQPQQRHLGFVFQSYALWPHMTVLEDVLYGISLAKAPDARSRAVKVLGLVGLEHLADRYPSELSGGQAQRVAVARALGNDPTLILFDEPLSNLDARRRKSMRVEIRRLQQKLGMTAIYVTHDQEEALSISDIVVVMSGGRIVESAAPEQLYSQPIFDFTASFIGDSNVLPVRVSQTRCGGRSVLCELQGSDVKIVATATTVQEAGAMAALAVKPEHLKLSTDEHAAEEAMTCVVESRSFLGATMEVILMHSVTGTKLLARLPVEQATAASVGAQVAVNVAPGSAVCVRPWRE